MGIQPEAVTWSRSWMSVLRIFTFAGIAFSLVINLVSGEVIPPLIAFVVLAGIGLYLLRSRPKGGALMLGIVNLLQVVSSAPFVLEGLGHPDSFFDFFFGWMLFVTTLPAIVAAWMVWKERASTGRPPQTTLMGAAALTVVLAAVGIIGTVTAEDVEAEPGDAALTAEDVEFDPEELQASSGEVSVHVDNKDAFRHTFTIDELDVNLELPAGKGSRTTFEAPSGDYEFYCTVPGHEDMKGTLSVE